MGLVAPQHVGSSQTRDQTHVPCIDKQILNHCATREVPVEFSVHIYFEVVPLSHSLFWDSLFANLLDEKRSDAIVFIFI